MRNSMQSVQDRAQKKELLEKCPCLTKVTLKLCLVDQKVSTENECHEISAFFEPSMLRRKV